MPFLEKELRGWGGGRGTIQLHCPLLYLGIQEAPGPTFMPCTHQEEDIPSPSLCQTSGARRQVRGKERDKKVRAADPNLPFSGLMLLCLPRVKAPSTWAVLSDRQNNGSSKDAHILIPSTCECIIHGTGVLRLQMELRLLGN